MPGSVPGAFSSVLIRINHDRRLAPERNPIDGARERAVRPLLGTGRCRVENQEKEPGATGIA